MIIPHGVKVRDGSVTLGHETQRICHTAVTEFRKSGNPKSKIFIFSKRQKSTSPLSGVTGSYPIVANAVREHIINTFHPTEESVISESARHTTLESILETFGAIVLPYRPRKIVIVTTKWHERRCRFLQKKIFRRIGFSYTEENVVVTSNLSSNIPLFFRIKEAFLDFPLAKLGL